MKLSFQDSAWVLERLAPESEHLLAEEVLEMGVPITPKTGDGVATRVLHPIHCVQSRAANVNGLPEQYASRTAESSSGLH